MLTTLSILMHLQDASVDAPCSFNSQPKANSGGGGGGGQGARPDPESLSDGEGVFFQPYFLLSMWEILTQN